MSIKNIGIIVPEFEQGLSYQEKKCWRAAKIYFEGLGFQSIQDMNLEIERQKALTKIVPQIKTYRIKLISAEIERREASGVILVLDRKSISPTAPIITLTRKQKLKEFLKGTTATRYKIRQRMYAYGNCENSKENRELVTICQEYLAHN